MFIGAFIAWVRHPSILFTFILRRCNAFIISVIVVIRRSIIFTEHFLWHLITMGKISIHAQLVSRIVMLSQLPYFHIWAMIDSLEFCSSHPDMVREVRTNFFICCDILGPLFCILDKSVWRWASLTLVSFLLYNVHAQFFNLQWTESCSNSISLWRVKTSRWPASLIISKKGMFSLLSLNIIV